MYRPTALRRRGPSRVTRLAAAVVRAAGRSVAAPRSAALPPLTFRQYVDKVRPGYQWYAHCVALAAVMQDVADGKRKRVMVFMPPRHGKSELVSRLFSGYFLYRYPERWVGINSYGAELAYTLSRNAKDFYVRAGGPVKSDAAAVKHWETGRGGGLWAAGVGGPITGKGFHLGVIDDPLKNAEEAASEPRREKQKEWYGSTFYTREEPDPDGSPDGAIVVIQTRWHEDDLSGWLLSEEKDGDDPERWHVVNMPALKEDEAPEIPPTCTLEPDPRAPGEALCPERRPASKLRQIASKIGSYFFAAMFQQRPAPADGGMFPATLSVVRALPVGCRFVRYWDKAGTEGGGCYTAGVLMARDPRGAYYVCDVVRGQWSAGNREKVIKDTAALDGKHVHVYVEQEPGSGGKESAENTVKMLAGYVCRIDRVTGDKVTRAQPLAAQAEVGNVSLLEGAWNKAFVDELKVFPNGKYKDQCDAASGAFNKLALAPRPAAAAAAPRAETPPVDRVATPAVPGGIPDVLAAGGF